MSLVAGALSMLSPAGPQARLSVFIFHRVLPAPDPIFPSEVDAVQFDRILGWLKSWFRVLRLDEAVQGLRAGTLPARSAAITFDDGYADNRSVALPLLVRHGLPATFFVATGYLDGGRMWNDTVIESVRHCRQDALDLTPLGLGQHAIATPNEKRQAIQAIIRQIKYLPAPQRLESTERIAEVAGARLPADLMMNRTQVRELHDAGMLVGAHTHTHPILANLDDVQAHLEIATSRDILEGLTGERVGLFAYPNGRPGTDYRPEQARLVERMGFDAAASTAWGAATARSDVFQVPRFTPWDRSELRFALRTMTNLARRDRSDTHGPVPRAGS